MHVILMVCFFLNRNNSNARVGLDGCQWYGLRRCKNASNWKISLFGVKPINEFVVKLLTLLSTFFRSEMYTVANQLPPQNIVTNLENTTSRRFIKSHLTYSLLHPNLLNNKQSKVIVTVCIQQLSRFFCILDHLRCKKSKRCYCFILSLPSFCSSKFHWWFWNIFWLFFKWFW